MLGTDCIGTESMKDQKTRAVVSDKAFA